MKVKIQKKVNRGTITGKKINEKGEVGKNDNKH